LILDESKIPSTGIEYRAPQDLVPLFISSTVILQLTKYVLSDLKYKLAAGIILYAVEGLLFSI